MNSTKLLKLAPMLSTIAFLGYAASTIQPVSQDPIPGGGLPKSRPPLAKAADGSADAGKTRSTTSPSTKPEPPGPAVTADASSNRRRDPFRVATKGDEAEAVKAAGRIEAEAKARTQQAAKTVEEPPPDLHAELIEGLTLNATFLQERTQMAVIDGRIYQIGQSLDGPGPESSPLQITRILRDRVILEAEGRQYALNYPDRLGGSVGAGPAGQNKYQADQGIETLDPNPQLDLMQALLQSGLGNVLGPTGDLANRIKGLSRHDPPRRDKLPAKPGVGRLGTATVGNAPNRPGPRSSSTAKGRPGAPSPASSRSDSSDSSY